MFDLPPLQEVVVHAASYHLDRSVDRNENNYGLGLRFKTGEHFTMVGGYRNSMYRDSFYAGVGKEFYSVGPLSFRLLAGIVTGYGVPIAPLVLPEAVARFGNLGVAVNFVPHIGPLPGVFGFSIVWRV